MQTRPGSSRPGGPAPRRSASTARRWPGSWIARPAPEPPTVGQPEAERLYRWLASPDGLTASVSTFGQRDVIKAVCNALPSGGRVDQVLDLVDGFLRSEHVLPVRVDDRAAVMYRRDGTVVAARTDEYRWTTPEMLETETRLLTAALGRRGTGTGVADDTAIQTAIDARPIPHRRAGADGAGDLLVG